MSIHSSLRGGQSTKHRSVLKRYERLKVLKEKNSWDETKPVLGLPKVKMQRIKVKKEKAATDTAPAAPEAAKAAAAASAAPGKKA